MIKCFVCSFHFANPGDLCEHIKSIHQISGQASYQCTLCVHKQEITQMWKYKRHLELCFIKNPVSTTRESVAPAHENVEQQNILKFESQVYRSALVLVCKLASKMSIPRNYVFDLLEEFRNFYSTTILDGVIQFVNPHVSSELQININYLLQICQDPFRMIKTECKLDNVLKKKDLISPLKTVDIVEDEYDHSDSDKTHFDETDSDETDSNETHCDETDTEYSIEKESRTIMPLAFQFKKFFELPKVYEMTQKYTEEVSNKSGFHNFVNGEVWKEKLKSYKSTDVVIPFHLHNDDTQINNALGTHRTDGMLTCSYYSFPTIPPQFNSRLENVFVAQFHQSSANKKFGNDSCFNELISDFNKLAHDGVILNIEGKEQKVFFVHGLFLGDNKGLNDALGFAKSHSANHFCRFCRLHKKETAKRTTQDNGMLRNEKNYIEDVNKNDFKSTGITEDSCFNKLHTSHVVRCASCDLMHDVNEGCLHYNMCEIILNFIGKGYFSLNELNRMKSDMSYGDHESGNKSPDITWKKLKSKKLLMTASEMYSFAHHFGLIVGDLIPKNDEVWKFYLKTIKFLDLAYSPSFTEEDIKNLARTISEMNAMYIRLFNEKLKPKHHYLTHYPTLIRRFGPLRFFTSMKFEAKHKMVKNYTKNIASRINVSHSLGRKFQYYFAHQLLSNVGLIDSLMTTSSKNIYLRDMNILDQLQRSSELEYLLSKNTKETEKIIINGIEFSSKLWVVQRKNSKLILSKILKIVYVTENISDVFFICKEYKDVIYNQDYGCYELNISRPEKKLNLISAETALKEHHYPVSIHVMNNNVHRFRVKAF